MAAPFSVVENQTVEAANRLRTPKVNRWGERVFPLRHKVAISRRLSSGDACKLLHFSYLQLGSLDAG
jgi:hypothetical protein